jgi:hypothetical protein
MASPNAVDGVTDVSDYSPIEHDSNEGHHCCQNQVPRQRASFDLVAFDKQIEVSRKPRGDVEHPVDIEDWNE